jgi:hypothetical protein
MRTVSSCDQAAYAGDSAHNSGINDAFAEPVTNTDDGADYAPTQILGELFKCAGYDGIRYKSKYSEFESLQPCGSQQRVDEIHAAKPSAGLNVALFRIADAEFTSSRLYRFAVNTHGQFDLGVAILEPRSTGREIVFAGPEQCGRASSGRNPH